MLGASAAGAVAVKKGDTKNDDIVLTGLQDSFLRLQFFFFINFSFLSIDVLILSNSLRALFIVFFSAIEGVELKKSAITPKMINLPYCLLLNEEHGLQKSRR